MSAVVGIRDSGKKHLVSTTTVSTGASDEGSVVLLDSTGRLDISVMPATQSANVVLADVACDVTVYVKAVVYLSAGTAFNALADSVSTSNIIGIVESKPTSTTCNIRVLGVTPSIFTGLDETKEYYLSDSVAGAITVIPPTTTGHVMIKIGQPFSTTEFLVLKGATNVRG